MRARLALAGLAAALPSGGLVRADTLCLKDGRIFDGVELERQEGAIVVHFENGDVAVPLEAVQDYVIEGDAGPAPDNPEEQEKADKGLVRFGGEWMRPAERERAVRKLVERQKVFAEEVREARLWRNRRTEETKHFDFEYTVPQEIFEHYRDRMEAYYEAFEDIFKIRRARGLGKLKVRFYADPENFYQVTGVSRGTLAFFEWTEEPYRLQFYYDRLDPLGTERDVFHELGHYTQKLIDTGFRYTHWPGESLAEYYSTGAWDPRKKRLTVEPHVLEERLIEIHRDMEAGTYVGIRDLIVESNERNYHDYNWGWSFVHFLMSEPSTRKLFEKFYLGLARARDIDRRHVSALKNTKFSYVEGEDMMAAFRRYMRIKKDEDLWELERRWHQYVKELDVVSSRGLARAADVARRGGRKHRARRLYEEAIEGGDAHSLVYHRYARHLASMDEDEAAWGAWKEAVARDPVVPEYYIAWGRSLLESDEHEEEGKRLLKLAAEIEPDNLYLERNLEKLLAK